MTIFIGEFHSIEDVAREYAGNIAPNRPMPESTILAELESSYVLVAWYGFGSYCGSSVVIYRKDEKFWMVESGHCSCFGLEGTWEPREVTQQFLVNYAEHAEFNDYDNGDEIVAALKTIVVAQQ